MLSDAWGENSLSLSLSLSHTHTHTHTHTDTHTLTPNNVNIVSINKFHVLEAHMEGSIFRVMNPMQISILTKFFLVKS